MFLACMNLLTPSAKKFAENVTHGPWAPYEFPANLTGSVDEGKPALGEVAERLKAVTFVAGSDYPGGSNPPLSANSYHALPVVPSRSGRERFSAVPRERFIGSWKLESFLFRLGDAPVYPAGQDARGILMYHENGTMAAQIMRLDRPLIASGDQKQATDAEARAGFEGYLAYFGRYTVDSRRKCGIAAWQAVNTAVRLRSRTVR